jgi:GT2 family glycosyltransferase
MDLSIIIVNWNSCDYLRKCLQSVAANAGALDYEVIVVDNASFDGSGEMLAKEFPAVHFIQSERNDGFARANNLGVETSRGRNILFLNPDTEVVGTALQDLQAALDTAPGAGIAGARLLNDDRTLQESCVQSFPSIWNQVLDADALRKVFPQSSLWGTQALSSDSTAVTPVEVISGACLMITRRAFEQVGLFSTDYFMYSEDVDLCFKVAQAGWKNYYVPGATVVHYGGRSSDSKPESQFATIMMRESQRKFFKLRKGAFHGALYQLAMGATAVCRVALIGGIVLLPLGAFRKSAMRNAFSKWVRVLRWSVGLEGWAKKPA